MSLEALVSVGIGNDKQKIYNESMTSFALLRPPTADDVEHVFQRVEDFLYQESVSRYTAMSEKTNLPLLFSIAKSGKKEPRFVYVQRPSVVKYLAAPANTSALDLIKILRQSGRAPEIAVELLGRSWCELSSNITTKTRELMVFPDVRAYYEKLASEIGREGAPLKFLNRLTNFSEVQDTGLNLRSAFALLLAFASEGCILHPLSLWRGMYPGSGASPQKYLESIDHPALVSAPKRRDLRMFEAAVEAHVEAHLQASTYRVGAALLHSTTARLADFAPHSVFDVMNAWQQYAYSVVEDKNNVAEGRKALVRCARALGHILVDGGRTDAETFFEGHRIPNNHNWRKEVLGFKRSPKFDLLRLEEVTEAGEAIEPSDLSHRENDLRNKFGATLDRDLSMWADLFVEYLKQVPVSRSVSIILPIHVFCDWLIAHGHGLNLPSDVERSDIARTDATTREVTFLDYVGSRFSEGSAQPSRAFGQAKMFMEWYQSNKNSDLKNPFLETDRPVLPTYDGKTSKESLPVRIISLMKEILTANDWEWAQQFERDYRQIGTKAVWCPVRAVALYVLLEIPLRTIQVRLLDSGEGDESIYDSKTKQFIRNPNGQEKRRVGVLRGFASGKKNFTGLHINTNKTQALYSASDRQGYDIMWENESVINALVFLRDWQMRYNPLKDPVHVNTLQDTTLHAPEKIAGSISPVYFLFRDAVSKRTSPHEPISHHRIEVMYLHLLAAVEERLRQEGIDTNLITEWEEGTKGKKVPVRAIVTLHSLRVSGITNFAEAGVPLHIITQFLAGHSTILMNLWYQKFGFATVNAVVTKAASTNMTEMAAAQFQRWISDQAENRQANDENSEDGFTDMCRMLLAAGSADAFGSMQRHPPGLWAMDIDGICPNGRTLCHEGGPRIGTKGWTRSTPVQGGRGNCPLCRYFVTGPMFLFGQIVKINVLLYHIQERSDEMAKLQDKLDDLQSDLEPGGDVQRKIAETRSAIEVIEQEVMNGLDTWVKRYEYLMKSEQLLIQGEKLPSNDTKNQLITSTDNDKLEVVPQSVSRFDLLEFVNQACEVIEGVDIASAKYKKARLLDLMLHNEGRKALMFALPEDTMLKAGNRLTRFMSDMIGQDGLNAVVSGQKTIAEAGIKDFDALFARAMDGIALPGVASGKNLPKTNRDE